MSMRGHWYFLGLISCLFSSLAVIEDSPTQGLRGVNNSQKEQLDFYSTDPFQCRDGTKLPGGSFVNDDYCDCPDGSDEPGTSACAGIHSSIEEAAPPPSPLFVCSSSSSSPLSEERITIPVSMVDDGVCDCCDGSDEKGTKCKDSCGTPIKSNAEKQKQMLRDNWRRKKEAVFGVAANVKGALEQQRAEILSAGRKITEMMAKGIQNSAARFQAQQKIQELRQRLQLTAMLLTADLGPHLASVQKCITSAPISEKLFAGGSKSYVAKEYVFIYCPFRHVLQSSVNLRQWVIANCMARMGAEPNSNEERICHAEGDRAIDLVPPIDYTGKIPRRDQGDDEEEEDFTGEMQKSRRRRAGKLGAERKKGEQSPPTLLGFWKSNGWGTNRSSNQSVEYAIFEDRRHPCENGLYRTVNVSLECGLEETITKVSENGMCQYEITVETLAACHSLFPNSSGMMGGDSKRGGRKEPSSGDEHDDDDKVDDWEEAARSNDDDDDTADDAENEDDEDEDWFEHDEL